MIKSTFAGTLCAAALALSACTGLPRGAALRSEIVRGADDPQSDFAFYQVGRDLLPALQSWPAVNPEAGQGWPTAQTGALGQTIAVGDRVAVRVWDNAENSLLAPMETRQANLGELTVSPAGRVFIPYVGEVRIAGMSPEAARAAIQRELASVSASAQVQLALLPGDLNAVEVVAGVAAPGIYPISNRSVSVLSTLSLAGGIAPTLRNPRVKLQRDGTLYATSLDALYDNPRRDTLMRAGDTLIVEEDERYFVGLGAAGTEDLVDFPQDRLTALEAVSLIGGLTDTRANPEGVLILRTYPRAALTGESRGPRRERVIFAIDLTTADGLFSAQQFQIASQDVVLATESPVSSIQVALSLLGGGVGFANQIGN